MTSPQWNWDDPDDLSGKMDDMLLDLARCEKLEALTMATPFTRSHLDDIGVTGIEFAAWKTKHPSGLASDLVGRWSDSAATGRGRIYRVDGENYFTELDISEPLPFVDGCVDWVYAEHLIEHVTLPTAVGWLSEVRRVLAPGGLLRLTTPDLGRYMEGYVSDDDTFFGKHRRRMRTVGVGPPMPERKAFMVNQIFYLYGHRWIYDLDELRYVLGEAGFDPDAVKVCAYRQGARSDVADLDQTIRNDETLYVEVAR